MPVGDLPRTTGADGSDRTPTLVAELVAADLLTTTATESPVAATTATPHSDPVAPPGPLARLGARTRDAYRLSSRLRPVRERLERLRPGPAPVPAPAPAVPEPTDAAGVETARSFLGHVLVLLERDHGIPEAAVLDRLLDDLTSRPEDYPLTAWTVGHLDDVDAPAVGWHACLEEVRRWTEEVLEVPPTTGLDTVFAVQRAVLRSPGRTFPATLALAHDYPTYRRSSGVRLTDLGPTRFVVPADVLADGRELDTSVAPGRVAERPHGGPAVATTGLAELDADGFMVVDLLDAAGIAAVAAELAALDLPDDHDFFVTVAHAWGPTARAFDVACRPLVRDAVERALPGFTPFLVAATSKGRRSTRPVKFHQDWTYTDERSTPTVFLWCPLTDVDTDTGCLHVVPGSHRWHPYLRAARSLEATEYLQAEFAARSRPVPLRAGQAVAFLPGTVHGSGPNRSDELRPAVTIASTAPDAELVHFHLDDEGTVTGYVVTDEFFTTNPYGTAPEGAAPLEPWDRVVTADDFVATMALRPTLG